ncbi:hypothetical protein [Aestuariivita boseongensis]|uniref:hypothetical protein n=1 Tax=Aestuariivita boseongensis TaxID=1470562 RepID=UPI000681AC1A|nr:hypothetical protein [Aestuariivita boseongensis]
MTQILHAAAIAVFTLGAGAATVKLVQEEPAPFVIPAGNWAPGAELDGRVFHTRDRIIETDEVLDDILHFRDGRFQSAMCQEYCDFGWSEYRTWVEGDVVHFTTTTRCPDAPHSVVWYGRVTGDEIEFDARWTTRRWYWTRHLNAEGAGSGAPVAGG